MILSWREVKNKIVINNKNVYMSFTRDELKDLKLLLEDIESDKKVYYKEDNR